MFQTIKSLGLIALLASASAVAAQDTTEAAPEAATATDATTTEAPTDAAAPAADAAPAAPQVGEPYVLETSGDWEVRCLKTEDGNDPCQSYMLLMNDQGTPVVEVSMFPLPEGAEAAAGAMVVVPLGTALQQGLGLSVDGSEVRRYPFEFCNAAGCVARLGFTAPELQQFKAGNMGKLRLVPMGADAEINLDISLKGFTAAFGKATVPLN